VSARIVSRRSVLGAAIGAAAFGASSIERVARAAAARPPVAFLSHGAPTLPIDPARSSAIAAWGRSLATPRGIVVMTPHFGARRLTLGATGRGAAMYNMPDGLRRRLPKLDYPSPPSDALASRVEALLGEPVLRSDRAGFDHTTWMPLFYLRPDHDAPVLELSYPYRTDAELFALGKRLAPLRDEGIFFLASGQMTHNLAAADIDEGAPAAWARDFDAWGTEALEARNIDALIDWRHKAPACDLAHPDDGGHFRVLLVALGVFAGAGGGGTIRFPIGGFDRSLSRRCVEMT